MLSHSKSAGVNLTKHTIRGGGSAELECNYGKEYLSSCDSITASMVLRFLKKKKALSPNPTTKIVMRIANCV